MPIGAAYLLLQNPTALLFRTRASFPDLRCGEPSFNHFQGAVDFSEKRVHTLKRRVCVCLDLLHAFADWHSIFAHQEVYSQHVYSFPSLAFVKGSNLKPSAPGAQKRANGFSCNERGWLWRITMRSNP